MEWNPWTQDNLHLPCSPEKLQVVCFINPFVEAQASFLFIVGQGTQYDISIVCCSNVAKYDLASQCMAEINRFLQYDIHEAGPYLGFFLH